MASQEGALAWGSSHPLGSSHDTFSRRDAGLPAAVAARRSRAVRLLVPGALLTLATHALILVGQPWWAAFWALSVGSTLGASAAVIAVWGIRRPGAVG